jgi:hypothetical protein
MHNEEGKLFEAVFYKLLGLGVAIVAIAAVVWIVWAIARTSAITNEAAPSPEPTVEGATLGPAPVDEAPLANVRSTMPFHAGRAAQVGSADRMVALTLRPVAAVVSHMNGRLPSIVEKAAADAAFFGGGPS